MAPRTAPGGRRQARRLFPLGPVCVECEVAPADRRHHWDGNPLNNTPGNVVSICAACHSRLHASITPEARARGIANARTKKLARTHCRHGHPLTPDNIIVRSDGGRRCLVCRKEQNARAYQRWKDRQ